MEIILVLLLFVIFIALVVGLIKPKVVIRWGNNPTRKKVVGWCFLLATVTIILMFVVDDNYTSEENINTAKRRISSGDYSEAIRYLERIKKDDILFSEAQALLANAKVAEKEKAEVEAAEAALKKAEAEAKKKADEEAKAAEAALKKAETEARKAKAEAEKAEEDARKKEEAAKVANTSPKSSSSKLSDPKFGVGKWKTTYVDNASRTRSYEVVLYNDRTAIILYTDSGQTTELKGGWSEKSESSFDVRYEWIVIQGSIRTGVGRQFGITLYVDKEGNGSVNLNYIKEGKPEFRFTRVE